MILINVASVSFHSIRLALPGVTTLWDLFFCGLQIIWNIFILWALALLAKSFVMTIIFGFLIVMKVVKSLLDDQQLTDSSFNILPLWITTFHLKKVSKKYFMIATLLSIFIYLATFLFVSSYLNQTTMINCHPEHTTVYNLSSTQSSGLDVTISKVKPCLGDENQPSKVLKRLDPVLAFLLGLYLFSFCASMSLTGRLFHNDSLTDTRKSSFFHFYEFNNATHQKITSAPKSLIL